MNTSTLFRPYVPDQLLLLPPNMKDWLPEDDLVYFIQDVVATLDLSAIYRAYDGSKGGQNIIARSHAGLTLRTIV